jgi:WhiB family redox-sensing transcriptional regulator
MDLKAEQDEPWEALGKCVGLDPRIFFPSNSNGEVNAAKRICKGQDGEPVCPVIDECLVYAMDHDERFGIWGGTSERERRRLRKTWRKGSSAA